MLAEDVLADEVVVDRPVAVEPRTVVGVADRGAVVDQRVEPHVGDVAVVPRERDAPRDRRAADREVEQPLLDEAQHLVALPGRLHRLGMLGVVLEQAVLVAREPEEVVLLGDVLDHGAVDRAAEAVVELVLLVVELAAHAVEALVAVELDVAVVVDPLEELLHRPAVAGLGGADVVVVGDVEAVPRGAEQRAVAVGPLERGDVVRLGRPLDLEAVLVGAGEEHDVVAPEAPPAGQHVGRDRRVRVPDVGRVVHVVDGRGDVEGLRHGAAHPIARGCVGHTVYCTSLRRNLGRGQARPGLQAHGGVVGAAAWHPEVAGDAGGGVAGRQAFGERGGARARRSRRRWPPAWGRRREHEHVLTARFGELHVPDGFVERAPPHLLVQLGELAGDGDLAQRAARGRAAAVSVACTRLGDSYSTTVRVSDTSAAMRSRRTTPRRGRKPSNTKRSVGNPDSTSAVSTALGPGTMSTASPASRQARTRRSPGSEMPGMPASVT